MQFEKKILTSFFSCVKITKKVYAVIKKSNISSAFREGTVGASSQAAGVKVAYEHREEKHCPLCLVEPGAEPALKAFERRAFCSEFRWYRGVSLRPVFGTERFYFLLGGQLF